MNQSITITKTINGSIEDVFAALVNPSQLIKWHNAGDGWTTPYAEVDPRVGGEIKIAYADPEGKIVFELGAVITELQSPFVMEYRLGDKTNIKEDDRMIKYHLKPENGKTIVDLTIDLEKINSADLQRQGWGAHLDNLEQLFR